MKFKILLTFAGIGLFLSMGLLFQSIQREKEREEYFLKENTQLQIHNLNESISSEIEKLKIEATKVASTVEAGLKTDAEKLLNHFEAVGAINIDTNEYIWQIQASGDKKTSSDAWSGPWLKQAKEIPETENQPHFYAIQTHDENLTSGIRSAIYLSAHIKDKITSEKKRIRIVGILNQPIFQTIMLKSQNSGVQFLLFNHRGLAIAHTVPEYVGNSLVGDKLFEDIRKNKTPVGNLAYNDFKGDPVFSIYEKLDRSDLILAAQIRSAQWVNTDWSYFGQVFIAVLGFLITSIGLFSFTLPKNLGIARTEIRTEIKEVPIEVPVEKIIEREIRVPAENIFEKVRWVKPEPAVINSDSANKSMNSTSNTLSSLNYTSSNNIQSNVPSIPQSIIDKLARLAELEKFHEKASKVIDPSLGVPVSHQTQTVAKAPFSTNSTVNPHNMTTLAKIISQIKAPILSILGHVQIAKSQSQNSSISAIETEARSARELLDRLGYYSGLSQTPMKTVPLNQLVESVIRSLEGPLLRGSVKIIKNIPEDINIKCDIEDFKYALNSILKNSIEAMERVLKKELNISITNKNNTFVTFCIQDSGEGILNGNMIHIFEPFYSTKSPLDHKGLGLASAQGIIRKHLGEITFQSDFEEGSKVTISLPISNEKSESLLDIQRKQRPNWMDLVQTPTKQSIQESEREEKIEIQPIIEPILSETLEDNAQKNLETVRYELRDLTFEEDSLWAPYEINSKASVKQSSEMSSNLNNSFPKNYASELSVEESKIIEKAILLSSSTKRLKKNDEPLDKLKVQIPRPEEKF